MHRTSSPEMKAPRATRTLLRQATRKTAFSTHRHTGNDIGVTHSRTSNTNSASTKGIKRPDQGPGETRELRLQRLSSATDLSGWENPVGAWRVQQGNAHRHRSEQAKTCLLSCGVKRNTRTSI